MQDAKTYRNFDKILKLAAKGDLNGVQKIIKKDNTILNRPSEGHNRTLVWEAVNSNRMELLKYLISQGANINIPGRYRSQTYVLLKPYCIAHKKKKEEMKEYLLNNGHEMDIFSLSYCGNVKELIKKISNDKNAINQYQKEDEIWQVSPLHFALSGENEEAIKLLLTLGAEVKKHSKLLYEIACRKNRLDIVKLLTAYGGVPSAVDVPPVFYPNNSELIEYFIENGLNTDKLFGLDWPPIAYLSRGDKGEHPERIGLLVKYVKQINAQTPKGVAAMHAASKAGYLSVLKVLLKAGGAINIRDKTGKTPLYYSRKFKRKEVEKYLMENGGIV